jgi:transposase-like protein
MRELSVAEQRYQAVLAVISDGLSVSQVAQKVGVSRQTLHSWLARYEAEGLEGWWTGRIGAACVVIDPERDPATMLEETEGTQVIHGCRGVGATTHGQKLRVWQPPQDSPVPP